MSVEENIPEVGVVWTVTLVGPRAADTPEHSVSGTGSTPDEAILSLRRRLDAKDMLIMGFRGELELL